MDDNLRHRARPDIVLKNDNQIATMELTYPYETNIEKLREFKKRRYENLKNELITPTCQEVAISSNTVDVTDNG